MSTAGIYNYHPKVEHPNQMFYQMDSNQPPFYFGGSQVPINTNVIHGTGVRTPYKSTQEHSKNLKLKQSRTGNGTETTTSNHNNIKMPYHLCRI
jgi:hypothetical protein